MSSVSEPNQQSRWRPDARLGGWWFGFKSKPINMFYILEICSLPPSLLVDSSEIGIKQCHKLTPMAKRPEFRSLKGQKPQMYLSYGPFSYLTTNKHRSPFIIASFTLSLDCLETGMKQCHKLTSTQIHQSSSLLLESPKPLVSEPNQQFGQLLTGVHPYMFLGVIDLI